MVDRVVAITISASCVPMLVVPFAIEQVRESAAAHMNQFVEDLRNNCGVVYFKVDAGLTGQA